MSGCDLTIGLLGLRQSQVAGQRDDAAELRIESLQAIQIEVRKALAT